MKRLVVCCDGTWQDLESPLHDSSLKRVKQFSDYRPKNLEKVLTKIFQD